MLNELFKDIDHRMGQAVEHIRTEFAGLRSGRASTALVDNIKVDYYGTSTPLNQVANISVPEPRLIVIQPWDKNLTKDIEKAIMASDLGLNPNNDGILLRIPIPALTEERRKDLVRLVHKLAEEGRVSIRNVRRDANDHIKKGEKEHEISEDNSKRAMENVQEITDKYIKQVDDLVAIKEKEIMTV